MKKLILVAALMVSAIAVGGTSIARADHLRGCGSGWGGGYSTYPTYSYGYTPSYSYGYSPWIAQGYGYNYYTPSSGFSYSRPGLSFSIGSGYRGFGYGGYSPSYHHHHRH